MKPLAGQLLLLLLLTLPVSAVGQRIQRPQFRAIVHFKDGGRISGILENVENGILYFDPSERIVHRYTYLPSVALRQVEWVVIKRTNKRKAVRTGMVIGGLIGGYFGYQSSQKSKFRSPVLAGISIALSAATLGGVGAVAGSLIGSSARRVIRPLDPDDPLESWERQLRPFTNAYLNEMRFDQ